MDILNTTYFFTRSIYMPEETICEVTMTHYEIIATFLAIMALIQPWAIAIFKKVFKPLKVSFIPSAKIKLYYNRSGAYIYCGGVIEAKNRSAVIKDISAKVIRQNDKAELTMDWSSFIVPVFQSVGGNPVTTNEIARPFMVGENNLDPIFVEFANADTVMVNRLNKIHEKLTLEAKQIYNINTPFDNAKEQLQAIPEYKIFREELVENFYWKASEYQLELSIRHSDDKVEIYRYLFSLNQDEINEFRDNIDEAMLCELKWLYYQPINFNIFQKDFVPSK